MLNFLSSHAAGEVDRRSQMASVREGCEEPEKILTRLMMVQEDVFDLIDAAIMGQKESERADYWCRKAL